VPGSSVDIATGYGLDGPVTESRCRTAHVQTGSGVHPASCTMGTGSFPGVESGRGVTLTPHPLLVPRSENSRAIPLLSLRAFVACKKCETYLPKPYRTHFNLGSPSDIQFSSCLVINYVWCCGFLKRSSSGCRRCPRRNKFRVRVPTVGSGRSDCTVYRPYRA
jgi:hypothetical protein